MSRTIWIWKTALLAGSIGAILLCPSIARAAVGISVTPSTITNGFVGSISLVITGLTAGKTVLVEKYTDFNTNGVIDASQDLLLQSFTVKDGQLPITNSVRNLNIVG